MTETTLIEGKWADGDGNATIEVGPHAARTSWINVGGGIAEVTLPPRETVRLAHALLTIAAAQAGIAKQVKAGEKWWADPCRVSNGPRLVSGSHW